MAKRLVLLVLGCGALGVDARGETPSLDLDSFEPSLCVAPAGRAVEPGLIASDVLGEGWRDAPARDVLDVQGIRMALFQDGDGTGESSGGETAEGGDLRSKVQNPIGALISVPFKFGLDFGAPDGQVFVLNIQPVFPITVGEWNLINRVIVPIIDVPGQVGGLPSLPLGGTGGGATGLGDINYSLFFSPAAPGKVIWGIGPSFTFPSATDDQLGTGQWSAGPTAVVLMQPKPWSLGVLARQLWSFAGDSDRPSVNQFLLEPFVNYNLEDGWFLLTDMVITANWNAPSGDKWTVPVGGGVGRLFTIGNQAVNMRFEAYYNVVHPDLAPDWSIAFTVQLLFPK